MPKFQHDCPRCIFVDHIDGHDGYVCVTTVVARYGDRRDQYLAVDLEVRAITRASPILRKIFDRFTGVT